MIDKKEISLVDYLMSISEAIDYHTQRMIDRLEFDYTDITGSIIKYESE